MVCVKFVRLKMHTVYLFYKFLLITDNDYIQYCFENVTQYSMLLNKVPYTSVFADTWPTYSCIHRNSVHLRLGGKKISLHRDVEHFSMHKDITPHFIRPEAETWQIMVWGWGRLGKRREKLN